MSYHFSDRSSALHDLKGGRRQPLMVASHVLDGPPEPPITYTTVCWNCKEPINNVDNEEAGFDHKLGWLGYECNACGKNLGDRIVDPVTGRTINAAK